MYCELMKKAELVAVQLLNQGCQPRDVIALFAPNSIDWIVVCLAAMRVGATVAAINALLTPGVIVTPVQDICVSYLFIFACRKAE